MTAMHAKMISFVAGCLLLFGLGLFLSASPYVEQNSRRFLQQSLKKASLSFAGARAVNALVSTAQELRTGGSVKLFGTGGSAGIAPLAWLDPLNDLVERFSLIMLASCLSLGIQLFLNEALPWFGLRVLLPAAAVILLLGGVICLWHESGRHWYRAGVKLLAVTILLLLMVPALALLNATTYRHFLSETYNTAASALEKDTQSVAAAGKTAAKNDLMTDLTVLKKKMARLKDKAAHIIDHILDLMLVFVIQTMVLPLVVFWLFIRLIGGVLKTRAPLP